MMDRRAFLRLAAGASAVPVLGACGGAAPKGGAGAGKGGGSAGSEVAPVTEVTIVSVGLDFDITTVYVPAGKPIRVTYDNRHKGVPHNVHVFGNGLEAKTPVAPGVVVQELIFTAPAVGRYDYICDVHPEMMKGIVVAV